MVIPDVIPWLPWQGITIYTNYLYTCIYIINAYIYNIHLLQLSFLLMIEVLSLIIITIYY